MKLTLEPTIHPPRQGIPSPTVAISYPSDDLTLPEVLEELVVPALLAAGYRRENIDVAFRDYGDGQDT